MAAYLPTNTSAAFLLNRSALGARVSNQNQPALVPKEESEDKSLLSSDIQHFAVNLRPLKRLKTTRAIGQLLTTNNCQDPKEDMLISSSSCACSSTIISEEHLCATPKAKEHRIPEVKACPPAPKKKAPAKRNRVYNHNQLASTLNCALYPADQRAYFVNSPDFHTFPDYIKALFKQ